MTAIIYDNEIVPACRQGACWHQPSPAAYLLPQVMGADETARDIAELQAAGLTSTGWRFVPVCSRHVDGWWEGSPKPDPLPLGYMLVNVSWDRGDRD